MKLKTVNKAGDIVLKDYDYKECKNIFIERNSYVLLNIRNYGDDYGGSHCSEEREETYEEIIPERILVKDKHFCGVLILSSYDYYNGGSDNSFRETMLMVDGSGDTSVRSGFSFSNDDHSRWDYTDTYLVERPNN